MSSSVDYLGLFGGQTIRTLSSRWTDLVDQADEGSKDLIVYLLLLALPPMFFYNVLQVNGTLSPGDGLLHYLPARVLAAEQWRSLTAPLWNPFIFAGFPLAAEIQTAAFYPPNFVFLFLTPVLAQNLLISLHYSLAGIFTCIYVRQTGLGRAAGVLAGIIFMFSGFLTAHRGHTSMHNGAIWLPLILYFCERWKKRGEVRYVICGAIAYCLQILAGDTKVPVLTAMLVFFYLAYFSFFPARNAKVFTGVLMLTAGGLLSAVQLLPTWELANLSVRRSIPYGTFVFGSLPPYALPMLVFPYLFGGQVSGFFPYAYFGPVNFAELTGYVGIIPWVFAGTAIVQVARDSRVRFWCITALLALLIAFGQYNPLYRYLYLLPLYNKLRIPARALLLLDFAIALLAAHGFHLQLQMKAKAAGAYRRHVRLSLAGVCALCVFSLAFVLGLKRVFAFYGATGMISLNADVFNSTRLDNPGLYVPVAMCVLSLAALTFFYRSKKCEVSITTLFSVLILDLFLFVHFSDSDAGYTKYWFNTAFQPETLTFLKREEPDFNRFRVLSAVESPYANVSETVGAFEANMNVFFKVPIVDGHDPLPLGWYRDHVLNLPIRTLIRDNRVLSLLNVKYLVASPQIAAFIESNRGPGFPDYRQVFRSADDLVIYRNPYELARASWVGRVRSVTDAEMAWKIVLDPLFNLREEAVVIDSNDSRGDDRSQRRTTGQVDVIEDRNQYMRLSVETDSYGFLVINQSHYPGWQAYIDGVAAKVYSADAILSGIFLEQGRHTVEWRFEPRSFRLGLTLTVLTGLACLVVLIINR